jgi:hypothetical protein
MKISTREYFKKQIPRKIPYTILNKENTKSRDNTWLFNG